MMNGLDLFSGIGGLALALHGLVEPIAYCEIDRYAQSVLLSRMSDRRISLAPIWDDVRTLRGECLPKVDIIYGGFPCQDISCAGNGVGLDGDRSGLFFEIVRLAAETRAPFLFLENVPAIRTRGLREVVRALTDIRYDCRWTCVSAAELGAPHLRKRWFLLAANSDCLRLRKEQRSEISERARSPITDDYGKTQPLASPSNPAPMQRQEIQRDESNGNFERIEAVAYTTSDRLQKSSDITDECWWSIEPSVGRVADGIPARVDRLRGLGNAVVPLQAKTAFERLIGIDA